MRQTDKQIEHTFEGKVENIENIDRMKKIGK